MQRMEAVKQLGTWNSLGTHGSLVVMWWSCISSRVKPEKFDFLSNIWPWRSRSIASQNNRDLNQDILHLWSKFGGPSLNGCGQAQNEVNLDFHVKFDLEGQGWSVHKTIGTLTKVFCIFGPNLVILAWTGPELSRGQASDWQTDRQTNRQTDAGNDNTRRPKLASGKNLNHRA